MKIEIQRLRNITEEGGEEFMSFESDDWSVMSPTLGVDYDIIWHPVMILDVLDYIKSIKGSFFFNNYPIEEVCSLLEWNWKDENVLWNNLKKTNRRPIKRMYRIHLQPTP